MNFYGAFYIYFVSEMYLRVEKFVKWQEILVLSFPPVLSNSCLCVWRTRTSRTYLKQLWILSLKFSSKFWILLNFLLSHKGAIVLSAELVNLI